MWVAAHLFLAVSTGDFLPLGTKGSVVAALTASGLAFIEGRRRRELGFLGNLGVPWTIPSAVAVVTVVTLEVLLTIALRV